MRFTHITLAAALALAAPASADTLIVGNKAEHTVSFVDLDSGSEVARVATGRAPHEVAISPDGKTALLVSYREQGYMGDTLHLFDVASGRAASVIELPGHQAPHGLKWIGDSDRVIVTTEASENVAIVDVANAKLVASIPTGQQGSHMVALSPDLSRAYVANIGSGTFTAIDLATNEKLADVPVGAGAEAITVSPDGREIWVGANEDRKVVQFDAATLEKKGEFATEGVPIRVEFSPDGRTVAVSLADAGKVAIYDAGSREQVAEVDLGAADLSTPVTILFAPDGSKLWAAATGSATIAEIETAGWTLARRFAVGEGSDGLAVSPVDTRSAPDTMSDAHCTMPPFARLRMAVAGFLSRLFA